MKEGGADVRILKGGGLNEVGATLVRHSRSIAQDIMGSSLAGYFLVGWDKAGSYSSCGLVTDAIPLSLLPAWVEEVARREFVTTNQIHEVLERDYAVTPPRAPIR